MSNHASRRIAQLRNLVRQGLHEENLDRLIQECNALAQDTPHVLLFFTLKSVFMELSAALEREPVEVSRFQELVGRITEQTSELLQRVEGGKPVGFGEIEELVRTHLVSLSLFRL